MNKTITFTDNESASTPKHGADLNRPTATAAAGSLITEAEYLDTTEGVIPVTFFDFTKKGGLK